MSARGRTTLVCLVLAAATLFVYADLTTHEFIRFDDDEYIYENPHVRGGLSLEGLAWAFGNFHSNNWHPLTWLVHMTDWQLFGDDAGMHHFTSLLFHTANALLLFLLLRGMTGATWPAAFVAALFALHPTHVESVAWASEKKDVVSTLFWILTTWAYWRYVRTASRPRYALLVVTYALGLLAKPMLITLPFTLLLLDYWPLGRCCGDPTTSRSWRFLLLEKAPLMALALASSVVTFLAQKSGGVVKTVEQFDLGTRLANATVAYGAYLGKLVWPVKLGVLYPHRSTIPWSWIAGVVLILAAVTASVFALRRRHRYLLVGWLWFLGTLIPVIGLVQVGNQAFADRYTYVPYVGLSVMIAWGAAACAARFSVPRSAVAALAVLILVALGARTRDQVPHWKNTIALFEHTVAVTRDNYLIHDNLGNALAAEARFDEALAQFREAVRIRPRFTQGHYNAGVTLLVRERYDEAIPFFEEAVRQQPDFLRAHFNLAVSYAKINRAEPSIRHFEEVLRIRPDHIAAHRSLGGILRALGRDREARVHLQEADRLERQGSAR